MAIPIPLLLLLGAGAVLTLRKRRELERGFPLLHTEDGFWIRAKMAHDQEAEEYIGFKIYDNQTIDILNNQAEAQAYQVFPLIRKGDLLTVSIGIETRDDGYRKGKAGLHDPAGPHRRARDPYYGNVATYVVAYSSNDGKTVKKDGRKLLIDANLIVGHGPKNWKIWDRKGPNDRAPSKHSTLALRGVDNALLFPEIMDVIRNKKKIFESIHSERNGQMEWFLTHGGI